MSKTLKQIAFDLNLVHPEISTYRFQLSISNLGLGKLISINGHVVSTIESEKLAIDNRLEGFIWKYKDEINHNENTAIILPLRICLQN